MLHLPTWNFCFSFPLPARWIRPSLPVPWTTVTAVKLVCLSDSSSSLHSITKSILIVLSQPPAHFMTSFHPSLNAFLSQSSMLSNEASFFQQGRKLLNKLLPSRVLVIYTRLSFSISLVPSILSTMIQR